MVANSSASAPEHVPLSLEAQATALWSYVHAQAPRFTLDAAHEVVSQVRPAPGEDPKPLAKRLREALRPHGISLKHTHALHAASRLNNHASWHTNSDTGTPRLRLFTLDTDVFGEEDGVHRSVLSASLPVGERSLTTGPGCLAR